MGELEKAEIYRELSEGLDNLDVILEHGEVDASEDDDFAEIFDSIERIRSIISEE
jgi:hypothetical protein